MMVEAVMTIVLGSILIYLMAESWGNFQRTSTLVSARAELAQEADYAFLRMSEDLRNFGTSPPEPNPLDPDALKICEKEQGCEAHGLDQLGHVLRFRRVHSALGETFDVCYFVSDDTRQLMRWRVGNPQPERVCSYTKALVVTTQTGSLYDIALLLEMPVNQRGGDFFEVRPDSRMNRAGKPLRRWFHLLLVRP